MLFIFLFISICLDVYVCREQEQSEERVVEKMKELQLNEEEIQHTVDLV